MFSKLTRQNKGDESKSQSFPCLEGDESQSQGYQHWGLEFKTQEERQQDFLDQTVLWKKVMQINLLSKTYLEFSKVMPGSL